MLNYLKESLGYKNKKLHKKLFDILETLKCSFICIYQTPLLEKSKNACVWGIS
jgi:hypothetical protein